MDIRYYLDPETSLPHIYEHGVTEAEVEWVLRNAGEERAGREDSRHALGQTEAGRYLRVIYAPEPGGVFVITAYDLEGTALRAYRRRHRGRGRR